MDAGPELADAGPPADAGDAPDAGAIDDAGCAAALDLPDDDYLDANCDGIDGDASTSMFVDIVSGDDADPVVLRDSEQLLAELSDFVEPRLWEAAWNMSPDFRFTN